MKNEIEKTRFYYQALSSDQLCGCGYCQNYRAHIRSSYPDIAVWLDSLGVDIEKPLETSPLEPNEHGELEYCGCQYILIGSCRNDFNLQIGDVHIRKSTAFPSTGIDEPHFVLEFFPVVLPVDEHFFI